MGYSHGLTLKLYLKLVTRNVARVQKSFYLYPTYCKYESDLKCTMNEADSYSMTAMIKGQGWKVGIMALNCKLILTWYLIKSDEWLDSNSYAGRNLWIWTLFQLTMFSMDGYMKNFFSRNFSLGNVSAQGYPTQIIYDFKSSTNKIS